MTQVPIFVLCGQSNVVAGGIDNKLFELASAQGSDFNIAKVGLGGTSIFANERSDWDPDSHELFDELVAKVKGAMDAVRAAGDEPVIYTFWVQGEQDSQKDGYGEKLSDFIAQYRAAIGQSDSPFVIAMLPYASSVRDDQIAVAATVANVIAVDPVGAGTWDGTHYDKPTREHLAELFFAAVNPAISSSAAYDSRLAIPAMLTDADGVHVVGPRYTDFAYTELAKPVLLRSTSGDDVITTGDFNDVISTGDNNDQVRSGGGDDSIDLGMHDDFAAAGAGNDTVLGGSGTDRILGEDGDDTLSGGRQSDYLRGGNGNDTLDGGAGSDRLIGDSGSDRLLGGAGADVLVGGADADTFVFLPGDFSRDTRASRDTIADFSVAQGDVLDLSAIDADVKAEGDNAFIFIGADKFHKVAGELRVATGATSTAVLGDTNGDGVADFWIKLPKGTLVPVDSIIL